MSVERGRIVPLTLKKRMPQSPSKIQIRQFTHGGCREFAVALRESIGGELGAFFHQPHGSSPEWLTHEEVLHAVVLLPSGEAVDAAGHWDFERLREIAK